VGRMPQMKFPLYLIVTLTVSISSFAHAQTYTVERVIDGDTIVVTTPEGKSEKVSLIGIDAPESKSNSKARRDSKRIGQDLRTFVRMGQEATEFVKGLIKGGQEVKLEIDVQTKDQYGRLLGYVFIVTPRGPQDKVPDYATRYPYYMLGKVHLYKFFLNATIINAGYATPMTIPPNVRYAKLFKELYEEARENKRGLWKKNSIIGSEVSFGLIEDVTPTNKDLNWEWVNIGNIRNPWLAPNDEALQLQYADFMLYCRQYSVGCKAAGSPDVTISVRSDQLEKAKRVFNDAIAINPNRWSKLNLNIGK